MLLGISFISFFSKLAYALFTPDLFFQSCIKTIPLFPSFTSITKVHFSSDYIFMISLPPGVIISRTRGSVKFQTPSRYKPSHPKTGSRYWHFSVHRYTAILIRPIYTNRNVLACKLVLQVRLSEALTTG